MDCEIFMEIKTLLKLREGLTDRSETVDACVRNSNASDLGADLVNGLR